MSKAEKKRKYFIDIKPFQALSQKPNKKKERKVFADLKPFQAYFLEKSRKTICSKDNFTTITTAKSESNGDAPVSTGVPVS
jgi:hypothetical protein